MLIPETFCLVTSLRGMLTVKYFHIKDFSCGKSLRFGINNGNLGSHIINFSFFILAYNSFFFPSVSSCINWHFSDSVSIVFITTHSSVIGSGCDISHECVQNHKTPR